MEGGRGVSELRELGDSLTELAGHEVLDPRRDVVRRPLWWAHCINATTKNFMGFLRNF